VSSDTSPFCVFGLRREDLPEKVLGDKQLASFCFRGTGG